MVSNQNDVNNTDANLCPQSFIHFPHQPYIAPGLSFSDNNSKFLGVFTATHLSICLLVSGFGLIVTGLLGVVTKSSLDEKAFHAVGIALICFGCLLLAIAVSIFVFAIRWGKKRVHVLERPNHNYPPITLMSVGYSYPVFTNTNIAHNNNNSQSLQTNCNIHTPEMITQSFYPIQPSHNPNFTTGSQPLTRPTAPPSIADSQNK